MGEWKQVGNNKLVYMFGSLGGWTPSADAISAVMGGVYNCKNVRFEQGKVKTRGGWSQFTTGEAAGDFSIMSYKDAASSKLLATVGNEILLYNEGAGTWDTEATLPAGSYAKTEFATLPVDDGTTNVFISDGAELPLRWDGTNKAIEVGSSKTSDMNEGWVDNTSTGSASIDANETTNILRGSTSLKMTATDADIAKAIYGITPSSQEWSSASKRVSAYRIGDAVGTEMQVAAYIVPDGSSFDTVEFYYRPENSPGSSNLFVRIESYSHIYGPSGTLIHPDAHGLLVGSESSGSKHLGKITLQSTLTYSTPCYVVFGICTDAVAPGDGVYTWDNQGSDQRYEIYYDDDLSGYGRSRSDSSDPQNGTWGSVTYRAWVKIYEDVQGTIEVGGADLADQGDDEVWVSVMSDDVSLVDDAATALIFTDSVAETATEYLNLQSGTDDVWQILKLPKDGFTESDIAFDWTDIVSISLELHIEGDSGTANLYIDQIRFVKTYVGTDATGDGSDERPPAGKYLESSPAGDRLIIANTDPNVTNSGANFLWYSDGYDPDTFDAANYISFPRAITGVKSQGGVVHVFAEDARWIMNPNYADAGRIATALDWGVYLATGPGTVSHRSIREGVYNGKFGLFFLAKDGIYFASGLESVKISSELDEMWERKYSTSALFYNDGFKESAWSNASAVWYKDRYYLFYEPQAQQDGTASADNEQVLILNTRTGGWEKDVPSASVFIQDLTVWDDSSGIPSVLGTADNGEVYRLIDGRATYADDGTGYQSDFQTTFIGTELMREVEWNTLNLWVRGMTTDATSLKIEVYTIEDYDDTTSFDEWEEDPDTAILTVTKAWTPNTAFKWHRLRIQLDDNDNNVYPTARAISLKIYDDNDKPLDYFLESLICTPLQDELR